MPELIPEGRYIAVATRVADEDGNDDIARWGTAGERNTRQVLIYFEIIEGDHAGEIYPWFGYFSKAAGKRTAQSLRYMGFKGDDLEAINDQDLNQKVQIVIGHNTYTKIDEETGEEKSITRARVDWVNRLGSGAIKLNNPMPQDELRKFAAMMKSRLASVPEVDGEIVSKANGSNGETRTESDGTISGPYDATDDPGPSDFDDIPF